MNHLLINATVFIGQLREKVTNGLKVRSNDKLAALPPRRQWQREYRETITNTDNHCVHKTVQVIDYQ